MKVMLTIILLCAGTGLTILMHGVGSNATQYQSEGIAIDYGNYRTVWTDISFTESDDPVELLKIACQTNYSKDPVFTDGVLTAIESDTGTIANDSEHTWDLWYVEKGKHDFVKSSDYNIKASDYTLLSWAYTQTGNTPTVGVDATGTSIYGYAQPHSVITLSPVCTELVGAMDAANMIVGTDRDSDYPSIVQKGKDEHTIAEVGTYTTPSYESIMHSAPDLVLCDASAYAQVNMAETLRNSNVNAVVIYDGTDLKTVLDNIFIVGTAMRYELRANYVSTQIDIALSTIFGNVSGHTGFKTLVTLSSDPSPFIAGTDTYINDILTKINGSNAVTDPKWPSRSPVGWPNVTPEVIEKINPDCILILDYGKYTASDYDLMISSLSDEWKHTSAYTNGNIYLFTESFGELAQRSGPRIAQLTEIIGRAVNPDAFTDGITLPHVIGNDYQDYLKYTKALGFGG